jgi:ATP-dependent RNA helicase DeaD
MPSTEPHPALAAALSARGYETLTPVQEAVLDPAAAGRDLLVSSRTGSGKTVAYGLALAGDLFAGADVLPPPGAPLALVVAPTRELALQVRRELEWLFAEARGVIASCVGGMDIRREQRALEAGAHVVVGTPGRLRDHLERGRLRLEGLKTFVLDEADEMLDLGFREELDALLDAAGPGRRTLLFSATLPQEILELAAKAQRSALRIALKDALESHADITFQAYALAPADLEHAVVNLLRYAEASGALVFCATREAVRRLHASLLERGFLAVALSGELSQSERNQALTALRDRRSRVCVATDVAARGLDIPDLELVIHAELPRDAQSLRHRSGRTGRAGRKGVCAVLVPYPRRRRAEALFKSANLDVDWLAVPSPDAIQARDQERLLEALRPQGEALAEDLDLARALLAEAPAEAVIAGLVRDRRARLPAPEDLLDALPPPRPQREGFEASAWFALNLGRRRNADPKWILPLLCRRGGVQRGEVGAIRVFDTETRVQIRGAAAEAFERRFREGPDDGVALVRLEAGAEADPPRREGSRPERAPPRARAPLTQGLPRAAADRGLPDAPQRPQGDRPSSARPMSAPRGAWRPDVEGEGAVRPGPAPLAPRPFKEKPHKGPPPAAAAKPLRGAPKPKPERKPSEGPARTDAAGGPKRAHKKLARGAPPRAKRR